MEFMHHEGEVVLPELLDKLDIEQPILLGHSDGGSIALIFAGNIRSARGPCSGSAACVRRRPQCRQHRGRQGAYRRRTSATSWGAITRMWSDLLGMERHLARSEFRSWNIETYLASIRCPVCAFRARRTNTERPRKWRRSERGCQDGGHDAAEL